MPVAANRKKATQECPCGFHGDPVRHCGCSPGIVDRYRRRLSGPLLDRIDLHVEVPRLTVAELGSFEPAEASARIAERVAAARALQGERLRRFGVRVNAELPDRAVRELARPPAAARSALERAVEHLGLSPRGFVRVLRVARTIADLAGASAVDTAHVLEALQYRALERREA